MNLLMMIPQAIANGLVNYGVKAAATDRKFMEMVSGIFLGEFSSTEYKGKVARRYLYLGLRDLLRKAVPVPRKQPQ